MKTDKLSFGRRLFALLTAVLLFAGGYFGARAMGEYDYWRRDDWQGNEAFENVLHRYIDRAMILEESLFRLEGEDDLSYVEREQLENNVAEQSAELDAARTWFRYQVRSADGTIVNGGNLKGAPIKPTVKNVHYALFPRGGSDLGDEKEYEILMDDPQHTLANGTENGEESLIIECGVPDQVEADSIHDEFTRMHQEYQEARQYFSRDLYLGVGLLAGAALFLLLALVLTGREAAVEGFQPNWFDRLWLELHLGGSGLLLTLGVMGLVLLSDALLYHLYYFSQTVGNTELMVLAPWGAGVLLMVSVLFGGGMIKTVVVRIASRTFAASTLVCRLWGIVSSGIRELSGAIPALWRVVIGFGLLAGFEMLAFTGLRWSGFYMIAWVLVNLAVLLYLCRWTMCFRKLREGCQTIAAGNLNHRIDTSRMPADLRSHGEDLNNISQGLSGAVEEKIKSERFKAELITNVSHDLKTPLTSIINYVNLLKSTDQTDPRAQEYIEVLDRKSLRLKKLTEDLVEASKASTGVLTVNREKIGMGQLLSQALAEWEEKLNERKLTVITSMPEEESWVIADGRHLWRVIDNLLSNCCKYAMEGTRVYLDLSRSKGQVTLEVKNISREPLNVPPEQLMERFVRGEESRSTEGSGLGLSIARSLTELQGGTFGLSVDGDLFKAVVSLTQAG